VGGTLIKKGPLEETHGQLFFQGLKSLKTSEIELRASLRRHQGRKWTAEEPRVNIHKACAVKIRPPTTAGEKEKKVTEEKDKPEKKLRSPFFSGSSKHRRKIKSPEFFLNLTHNKTSMTSAPVTVRNRKKGLPYHPEIQIPFLGYKWSPHFLQRKLQEDREKNRGKKDLLGASAPFLRPGMKPVLSKGPVAQLLGTLRQRNMPPSVQEEEKTPCHRLSR